MISPFSIEEKQKLIETPDTREKIKILNEIINLNLADNFENKTIQ
jgi:Lon protease-like protein